MSNSNTIAKINKEVLDSIQKPKNPEQIEQSNQLNLSKEWYKSEQLAYIIKKQKLKIKPFKSKILPFTLVQ